MKTSEMKNFKVTAVGLFRPAGTSYAIYEATLPNGDTHCAGASSEEEFRDELTLFYGKRVSSKAKIRKLPAEDIGNGWKQSKGG